VRSQRRLRRLGGPGLFCGVTCKADADCPADFTCIDGADAKGNKVKQCKPAQDAPCTCSAEAVAEKLDTTCYQGKGGACQGSRTCVGVKAGEPPTSCTAPGPAKETCDGIDQDCDGATDQDVSCDDGNVCTADSCAGAEGCAHKPVDGKCDDGDKCVGSEACKDGACVGKKVACDDGNPCTNDSCDAKKGCLSLPNAATCTDGDACTKEDGCAAGECGGEKVTCDDDNGCTDDNCDKANGCVYAPNAVTCIDGDACTGKDACKAGKCAGSTVSCDDGNGCTDDSCDKATGCAHKDNSATCSDGDACTVKDGCKAGKCVATAKNCDDGEPCTKDSCATKDGKCLHGVLTGDCDPGKPCLDAFCVVGKCTPKPAWSVRTIAGRMAGPGDGPALEARLRQPRGLAMGAKGALYISDAANHRIRRLDLDGTIATVAGSDPGFADGKGMKARFNMPADIATDAAGAIYVADAGNFRVRKVALDGTVTTIAGSGKPGNIDGKATAATFNQLLGIAVDAKGNVFVSDHANHNIRRISTAGVVTTFVGGTKGYADGKGTAAKISRPAGLYLDAKGDLHFADLGNNRLRKVAPDGTVSLVAGTGAANGGGNTALKATFWRPTAISGDGQGGFYISENTGYRVRHISASGAVTTVAGKLQVTGTVDGPGGEARFHRLGAIVHNGFSTVYVADSWGHRIRGIDSSGNVSTVVGHWRPHADGKGHGAALHRPIGVAMDGKGQLWIAESAGNRVRRMAPDGSVVTIAGSGKSGTADGKGLAATFAAPVGITTDQSGNAYVGGNGKKVRKVSPLGVVTTLAGGKTGYHDGKGAAAGFGNTNGVAADAKGDIYVADSNQRRIRKVTAGGVVTTVAGSGKSGSKDGKGMAADFMSPTAIAIDAKGVLFIADHGASSIRRIAPDTTVTTLVGGAPGFSDGKGKNAALTNPLGIAMGSDGALYLTDHINSAIRRVTLDGVVTTIAGGGHGHRDGAGPAAQFQVPWGIAATKTGGLVVAGFFSDAIRLLKPPATACDDANPCTTDSCDAKAGCKHSAGAGKCDDGLPCTTGDVCKAGACAGQDKTCDDNGPCTTDACDPATGTCGHVAITGACDDGNACTPSTCFGKACKATPQWPVSTLAGSAGGFADGPGKSARFRHPMGVGVDAKGHVWVAEEFGHRVRRIAPDGTVSTVAGGAPGDANGTGDQAQFRRLYDVALAAEGHAYVSEFGGHRIRKVTAKGEVSTVAGSVQGYRDGYQPLFSRPAGLAIDKKGAIVVAEAGNHRIRRIVPGGPTTTLAGGAAGFKDGPTATAQFNGPRHVTFDSAGNLLICDRTNQRIRRLGVNGKVTTLAGNGQAASVDGPTAKARLYWPSGIAVDAEGMVFFTEPFVHRVRRLAPDGTVMTLASGWGYKEGKGTNAAFDNPRGIALTADGLLIVADSANHLVRRVTKDGQTSLLAGVFNRGNKDGFGKAASLRAPAGIGSDAFGNVFVADNTNQTIRKITPAGLLTTVAGSGKGGFKDGAPFEAMFNSPNDVEPGPDGSLYVTDYNNMRIRRVAPDGQVSTFASGGGGYKDGPPKIARFTYPIRLAMGPKGALYVSDRGNFRIRKVAPDGTVSTFAGNGKKGYKDGKASEAEFGYPSGIDVDGAGNVFVSDRPNRRIRRISVGGVVSTVAGTGVSGTLDGPAGVAQLQNAWGLLVGAKGVLFVSESQGKSIRRIATDGSITTIAGVGNGYLDGHGGSALMRQPRDLAFGPGGIIYFSEPSAAAIRFISPPESVCDDGEGCTNDSCDPANGCNHAGATAPCNDGNPCTVKDACKAGQCTSTAKDCGDGKPCTADACDLATGACSSSQMAIGDGCDDGEACTTSVCLGGGCAHDDRWTLTTVAGHGHGLADGKGGAAGFSDLFSIDRAPDGSFYIADGGNAAIRKMTADGTVTTIAGGHNGHADGTGKEAGFVYPVGVSVGPQGLVYIADSTASRIRKMTPDGVVTTLAGSGVGGFVDGAGNVARFKAPWALDVDSGGNVIVADLLNHSIRKVAPDGQVTTLAGKGSLGYAEGKGKAAALGGPRDIVVAPDGVVFVTGSMNNRIRRIATDGTTNTFAGSGTKGFADGPGTQAKFDWPTAIDLDASGNLVVYDQNNRKLRRINKTGVVSTLAGTVKGYLDGPSTFARLGSVYGLAVDPSGNVWLADTAAYAVRKLSVSGVVSTVAGGWHRSSVDGKGPTAGFVNPRGGAVVGSTFYVAEAQSNRIRQVESDGTVTTLAGGIEGLVDGQGVHARFKSPTHLAYNGKDALLCSDGGNHQVRKVGLDGAVSPFAGSSQGFADGKGSAAKFNGPAGLVVGAKGDLYVADFSNHRVRKVTPSGNVSTFAGGAKAGKSDGKGSAASFNLPAGLAIDAQSRVIVVEYGNSRLRRISADGTVTTLVGGELAHVDGPLAKARFMRPWDVVVDGQGRLVVSDRAAHTVRLVTLAGPSAGVTTLVGSTTGWVDGKGLAARLRAPRGLALLPDGSILVVDTGNKRIRKLTPPSTQCDDGNACTKDACDKAKGCSHAAVTGACDDGNPCTTKDACKAGACVAGPAKSCDDGNVCTADSCGVVLGACAHLPIAIKCDDGDKCTANACLDGKCKMDPSWFSGTLAGAGPGNTDGKVAIAAFNQPFGLVFDTKGDLLVADGFNHAIRKITPDGVVSTLVGAAGGGYQDGPANKARLQSPRGVALDGKGNVYIADKNNRRIRVLDTNGQVTTLAGNGAAGVADGYGVNAGVDRPHGIAVGPKGNVYFTDQVEDMVRRVNPDGHVVTVAGASGQGFQDGPAASAKFNTPSGIAVDGKGVVWVADYNNHRIRRIGIDGIVSTVAGSSTAGLLDGKGGAAKLLRPSALALGPKGAVWFTSNSGNAVRRMALDGTVTTLAGGTPGSADGKGKAASFLRPRGIALNKQGVVLVGDTSNHTIRKVLPDGTVSTWAGNAPGSVDGPLDKARFIRPIDAVQGADGAVYVADTGAEKIRKIHKGQVTTLAGSGKYEVVDGKGAAASFKDPRKLAIDAKGVLYMIGYYGHAIRRIDADGTVTTVVGAGSAGNVDAKGKAARFAWPLGFATHPAGGFVVADSYNYNIRRVTADGTVSTIAGSGKGWPSAVGVGFADGKGSEAMFRLPVDVVVDSKGAILVVDISNHRIRKVAPDGKVTTLVGDGVEETVDGPLATARLDRPSAIDVGADGAIYFAQSNRPMVRRISADGKRVDTLAGQPAASFAEGKGADVRFNSLWGLTMLKDGSLLLGDSNNARIRTLKPPAPLCGK